MLISLTVTNQPLSWRASLSQGLLARKENYLNTALVSATTTWCFSVQYLFQNVTLR